MLSKLIPEIDLPDDIMVSGISDDSRKVKMGDLFLAVKGAAADGREFIRAAEKAGAVAVLVEEATQLDPLSVPVLPVAGLGKRRGEIAAKFYEHPSSQLRVIAITGTNGKTSCCQFIAQALGKLNRNCGTIGTLGYGLPGQLRETGLTTPGALDLQRILREFADQSVDAVALEASSHGLSQGRLDAVAVDTAIFTNLSRDHLDYHVDFESYRAAKASLFQLPGLRHAVINIDDETGRWLANELPPSVQTITCSLRNPAADIHCETLSFDQDGFLAGVNSPWGKLAIRSQLMGDFNVLNLLAVVAVIGTAGYPLIDICQAMTQLTTVPGRMDRLPLKNGAMVVIDYSHTPDALEKALDAARLHCRGKLWCVMGCGGNRDKGKRPEMGRVASSLADQTVITDDNPRLEDSSDIIEEIKAGVVAGASVTVEPNRPAAIAAALRGSAAGDVILIAGKGHEPYQDVGGAKHPYSDYEQVELFEREVQAHGRL